MFDMFSFWWKDALALYDSTELSDLWPVTVLMCLASALLSDNTVTAVALTQWFVRCGVIPAALLTVFIILASVDSPTGELQYHTVSFLGLNFPDCSLGRWNRQSNLGLRCLMKFSIVFTGQRLELIASDIFPSDSSVESLSPP